MKQVFVLVLLVASFARGQTNINIDFGTPETGPPADFAGVGVAGVWNVLSDMNSTPRGGFVDVNGHPVGLTLASSRVLFDVVEDRRRVPLAPPLTALLSDYLCGAYGDLVITFAGLEPGRYRLITYYCANSQYIEDIAPTTIYPLSDPAQTEVVIGHWPGGLKRGDTHSFDDIDAPNGSFGVQLLVDGDAFANGVQLIQLPEPGAAAIMLPMVLLFGRSPCHGPRPR